MAQTTITRRYRFCAAHRLHTEHLSAEENWAAFGKCNNPNGHGHNYVVLVTVSTPETGRAVDHDLNQDPEFADRTTTGENLVLLIWDLLAPHLPQGQLKKVGVIETRDNYFEYAAPSPAGRE
jgi:6-pyruvoyltetrahydropterin/6-carboxytetrahydropterin synthase